MTEDRRQNPQPLTQEQLAWITEQTERAARKAGERGGQAVAKHVARRATLGFIILLIGLIAVRYEDKSRADQLIRDRVTQAQDARDAIVRSGRIISIDGCNRDFKDRVEIRSVLIASKAFQKGELRKGNITQERYDKAAAFYDERLAGLPLPDCRRAARILTDDPKRVQPPPSPLYPGARGTGTAGDGSGASDPGARPDPGGGGG